MEVKSLYLVISHIISLIFIENLVKRVNKPLIFLSQCILPTFFFTIKSLTNFRDRTDISHYRNICATV